MEDINNFAKAVAPQTKQLPSIDGTYLQWRSTCGAELWLQIDRNREYAGINPHFHGPARMRVGLTAYMPSETPSVLDGSFHGWSEPAVAAESNEMTGTYPFVFDAPDASVHRNQTLPIIGEVQIAAFAHEIALFEDEATFYAAQTEDSLKMAAESFIPSGLFGDREGTKARGLFVGKILAVEHKTNSLTNISYWWALVQTLGGQFDVVIDPALVERQPVVGGLVQGSFWLSGRILSDSPSQDVTPAKKGFWSKLFGKAP
ncbi:MAG: hypothetical protein K9N47_22895 [Prosthecobacter sp.]|nr:hypothetical protein [Prosthecobacter sp.]